MWVGEGREKLKAEACVRSQPGCYQGLLPVGDGGGGGSGGDGILYVVALVSEVHRKNASRCALLSYRPTAVCTAVQLVSVVLLTPTVRAVLTLQPF